MAAMLASIGRGRSDVGLSEEVNVTGATCIEV